MKEFGSFIELQMPNGQEYYNQTSDIARLNTGRSAIWHAFRCTSCSAIWIPIYQCDSIRKILLAQDVEVKYYRTDYNFNPIDLMPSDNEAVLFVNYYGIMSYERMKLLSNLSRHPIIDNCQSFFTKPIPEAFNIYSCRKFIGVADGAYVIGHNAQRFTDEYAQGYSSDTAKFLLTRIEYGCEGKGYAERSINEQRIDTEGVKLMSKLTRTILDGTDYTLIKNKRRNNFSIAHQLLGSINKLNPLMYYDDETIPMVYPLLVENDSLIDRLYAAKHFQGHWWSYICDEQPENYFEHWISRYIIPITIDQRYSKGDIEYLAQIIKSYI